MDTYLDTSFNIVSLLSDIMLNNNLTKDKEIQGILSLIEVSTELDDINDQKERLKLKVPFLCLPKLRQKLGAKKIDDEKIRKFLINFALSKLYEHYDKVPPAFGFNFPYIQYNREKNHKNPYFEIICTLTWNTETKTYQTGPFSPEIQRYLNSGLSAIEKVIRNAPNLCRFLKPHNKTISILKKYQETGKISSLFKALEKDLTPLILGGIEKGDGDGRYEPLSMPIIAVMTVKQFEYPNPKFYVGNNILGEIKDEPTIQFIKNRIYEWELECCDPNNKNNKNEAWKNLNKIKSIFEKRCRKFRRNKGQKGRKIKSELIREIVTRYYLPEVLTVIHSNLIDELADSLNRPYSGKDKWEKLKTDIVKFASISNINVNKKDLVERRIKDNKNLALLLMACDIKCPFDTLEVTFRKLPNLI